jgi:hypothetical protein
VYITAGWGERNQWYQNILADPNVTVQRHGRIWGAEAVRVTDISELEALYHRGRHSPMWKSYLGYWKVSDTLQDFLAARERLIALRLDRITALPLAPQESDLLWIWQVTAIASILLFRRRA